MVLGSPDCGNSERDNDYHRQSRFNQWHGQNLRGQPVDSCD